MEIRESYTGENTNRETQERESRRSRMGNWLFIGTLGMYVMSWREACLPSLVYTEKWPCDTHCGALLPHTHTPDLEAVQSWNVGEGNRKDLLVNLTNTFHCKAWFDEAFLPCSWGCLFKQWRCIDAVTITKQVSQVVGHRALLQRQNARGSH